MIDRPLCETVVYVIYPRCYEAEPINRKGITHTTACCFRGVYVAYTTVECLPPITGRKKLARALLLNWVTPLVLGSLENKGLKSVGYVIDRPQGSCGVWDIPKVLRGEAE